MTSHYLDLLLQVREYSPLVMWGGGELADGMIEDDDGPPPLVEDDGEYGPDIKAPSGNAAAANQDDASWAEKNAKDRRKGLEFIRSHPLGMLCLM